MDAALLSALPHDDGRGAGPGAGRGSGGGPNSSSGSGSGSCSSSSSDVLSEERARFHDFIRGGPLTPFQLFDFFVDLLSDDERFVDDFERAVRVACDLSPGAGLPVFLSTAQCEHVWRVFVGSSTHRMAAASFQANTGVVFLATVFFWVFLPVVFLANQLRVRCARKPTPNANASTGAGFAGAATAAGAPDSAGHIHSGAGGAHTPGVLGRALSTQQQPLHHPDAGRPVSLDRLRGGYGGSSLGEHSDTHSVGGRHSAVDAALTKRDSSDTASPSAPSPFPLNPAAAAAAGNKVFRINVEPAAVPAADAASSLLRTAPALTGAYGATDAATSTSALSSTALAREVTGGAGGDALPGEHPNLMAAPSYQISPNAAAGARPGGASAFSVFPVAGSGSSSMTVPPPSTRLQRLDSPPPPHATPFAIAVVPPTPQATPSSGGADEHDAADALVQPTTVRARASSSLAAARTSLALRGTMSLSDAHHAASASASTIATVRESDDAAAIAVGATALVSPTHAHAHITPPLLMARASSASDGGDGYHALLSGQYQAGAHTPGPAVAGARPPASAAAASHHRSAPTTQSYITASYRKNLRAVGWWGVAVWACAVGAVGVMWWWRDSVFAHLYDVELYTPLVSVCLFVVLDSGREASVDEDYRTRRRFIQKFTYRLANTKCCFGLDSSAPVPVSAAASKYPTNALALFESIYQHRESATTKFKQTLASHVSLVVGLVHAALPLAIRLTTGGSAHASGLAGEDGIQGVSALNRREVVYVMLSLAANTVTSALVLRSILNGLVHWDTYYWMMSQLSDVANYATNHVHQLPFRLDLNHPQNVAAWIEVRMIVTRYMHSGSTTIQSVDNFIRHLHVFVVLFLCFFVAMCADLFTGSFTTGPFEWLAIFDGLVFCVCIYRYVFVASNLNAIMREHVAILRAHQFQISRALLRFREHHFVLAAAAAAAAAATAVKGSPRKHRRSSKRSPPLSLPKPPDHALTAAAMPLPASAVVATVGGGGGGSSLAAIAALQQQRKRTASEAVTGDEVSAATTVSLVVPPRRLSPAPLLDPTAALNAGATGLMAPPTSSASASRNVKFGFVADSKTTAVASSPPPPLSTTLQPSGTGSVTGSPVIRTERVADDAGASPPKALHLQAGDRLAIPLHHRSQSQPPVERVVVQKLESVYGGSAASPQALRKRASGAAGVTTGLAPSSAEPSDVAAAVSMLSDDESGESEADADARAARRAERRRRAVERSARRHPSTRGRTRSTADGDDGKDESAPNSAASASTSATLAHDRYTSAIVGDAAALESGADSGGSGSGETDSDERILGASSALLSNCIQLIHEADFPLKFFGYAMEHSMLYTATTTLLGIAVIAVANFTNFNI